MQIIAKNNKHRYSKGLSLLGLLIIGFVCFGPLVFLLIESFALPSAQQGTWDFLAQSLLPTLLGNTTKLVLGVALSTTILGSLLASLVVFTNLPGKKYFDYLFIIPITLPLYLLSFIYVGMLEYSGPLLSFLRNHFALELHHYFAIKSTAGVIIVFTLGLYPYVYLLAKAAFLKAGDRMTMVSRSLGHSADSTLWRIILPYSLPWIFTGTSLAVMEALADFGGVSVFNYDTFTTAIYSAWTGLYSISSAARLSCFLILFALLLYLAEFTLARRTRFTSMGQSLKHGELKQWGFWGRILSFIFALCVVLFSLIIPSIQLVIWFFQALPTEWSLDYLSLIYQTFIISFGAAFFTALVSLLIIYCRKMIKGPAADFLTTLSLLGYALPGSLIAVAVFLYLQWFMQLTALNLFKTGSLTFLFLGYCIRYLSVGFRTQNSSLKAINPNYEKVAKTLGAGTLRTLKQITLPLISPAFFSSLILLFIEVLKEMPMTLMLRPFGFSTLTVRIYELTAEGEWERASIAGLFILLTGMLGSYILLRFGNKGYSYDRS